MNEFERLLGQVQSVRLLQSIELASWSIAGLLLILAVLLLVDIVKRHRAKDARSDWNKIIEEAYEAGRYEKALQTLATCEQLFPRSASIMFWQGRCYFQQELWEKAVEKFDACCRLEPPYRRSVRDYLAFIELNDLVPGVTGYLERGRIASGDAGEGA